jgi:hypothetical protein
MQWKVSGKPTGSKERFCLLRQKGFKMHHCLLKAKSGQGYLLFSRLLDHNQLHIHTHTHTHTHTHHTHTPHTHTHTPHTHTHTFTPHTHIHTHTNTQTHLMLPTDNLHNMY